MFRLIAFIGCFLFSSGLFAQDTINQVDAQGRKQGFWRKMDKDNLRISLTSIRMGKCEPYP